MTECLVCAGVTKDVWLCARHRDYLLTMLNSAPGLARQLTITAAKLDQVVRNVGGHQKNGAAPSIVNFDAADLYGELRATLLKWVKRTAGPVTAVFPTVPAMVLRLRAVLPDILTTQDAGFMYDDLNQVTRRATLAIDLPPSREGWDYAGPCGMTWDNGTCLHQLWVRHGEASAECKRCGTVWDVTDRRAKALAAAANLLATTDTISRALTSAGQTVSAATIYHWRNRGRLTPAGTNKAGQPLYRVGDVMDLVKGRK